MLGSPYERGQSDVIVQRVAPDTAIGAGFICVESGTTIAKFAGSGTPIGVSGNTERQGISLVKAGLKVRVRTEDESAVTGAAVYATSAGLASTTAQGNTAINATVSPDDSVLTNEGEETDGTKYIMIDFPVCM